MCKIQARQSVNAAVVRKVLPMLILGMAIILELRYMNLAQVFMYRPYPLGHGIRTLSLAWTELRGLWSTNSLVE